MPDVRSPVEKCYRKHLYVFVFPRPSGNAHQTAHGIGEPGFGVGSVEGERQHFG